MIKENYIEEKLMNFITYIESLSDNVVQLEKYRSMDVDSVIAMSKDKLSNYRNHLHVPSIAICDELGIDRVNHKGCEHVIQNYLELFIKLCM